MALEGTIWKPRWWVYLFPVSMVGRVRVRYVEDSEVDGSPRRAVCATDDGRTAVIDLNRHKDGLFGFRRVA